MMGWGIILEQEVAPSEDGADTLLRRFAHLEWRKKTNDISFKFTAVLKPGIRFDAF